MVALLIDLGADPLAVDGSGFSAAAYATSPDVDRRVMEAIGAMTAAELTSAERGDAPATRSARSDLMAALALGEWETATRLVARDARSWFKPGGPRRRPAPDGQAQRCAAVQWLLDHGADPNARWSHWDSEVTPLHLAVLGGHAEIVRAPVHAGADPRSPRQQTRQRRHRLGRVFLQRQDIVQILEARPATPDTSGRVLDAHVRRKNPRAVRASRPAARRGALRAAAAAPPGTPRPASVTPLHS